MTPPTRTLPSGDDIPQVGFGTWNLEGRTVETALRSALDAGYTHVDTAEGYHNEDAIGDVLAEYDRDSLFLTSKVLPKHLDYQSVIDACTAGLDRLGVEYLDLYLVHWPNPAVSMRETFDAMEALLSAGRVRNVGVSNFSRYQLSAAQHVADVPIAVNQIEFHPWHARTELLEYCRETDTIVEAAAPLARTAVLEDPTLVEIADAHDRSPAQVALRWAIEKGVVVLPKSSNPDHIEANRQLFDWELSAEDRRRIDDLDRREPVYDTRTRSWDDPVWGIAE